MLTHILVELQVLPNKLDFGVRIFYQVSKTLLDGLNLLRDSTQDPFFKSIKFVETSPSSHLT